MRDRLSKPLSSFLFCSMSFHPSCFGSSTPLFAVLCKGTIRRHHLHLEYAFGTSWRNISGGWLNGGCWPFTAIASWLSRKLHPNGHPVAYVFTSFLVVSLVSFPFASVWWWVAAVLIALCIALLLVLWRKRLLRQWGSQRSLWQNFMPPTVFLLVLGLYMGGMAAVPDTVHYELRTAAALHAQHPHRAYKVGKKSLSTSPRLFALRCYLMADHWQARFSRQFLSATPSVWRKQKPAFSHRLSANADFSPQ